VNDCCAIWLDPKITKKSSRNTAALRSLPVLNALPLPARPAGGRSAPLSKAKPSFPPYARPAPLRQGPRSFFPFLCSARLAEAFLLTGGEGCHAEVLEACALGAL